MEHIIGVNFIKMLRKPLIKTYDNETLITGGYLDNIHANGASLFFYCGLYTHHLEVFFTALLVIPEVCYGTLGVIILY